MKKTKNSAKKMPDPSALDGFPTRNPHADYITKDAIFKDRRGTKNSL